MSDIQEALDKEAKDWLKNEHSEMDWISHCMVDPSDELVEAFQNDCPDFEEVDEEEYQDDLDEKIMGTYYKKRGQE